jgi:hypothetical protein
MRPQGTNFAESAKNRDSVMSLGSIAHMQYYFARTGLLDGKGGQLAKDGGKKKKDSMGEAGKENVEPSIMLSDDFGLSALSIADGSSSSCAVSDSGDYRSVVESPTEIYEAMEPWSSPAPPMLPPTVSTYKLKPSYTEPLPDLPVLRRELKEALQDACKVLEEAQKESESRPATPLATGEGTNAVHHELQGLHLLDIMTLAIRAAKNYYTAHSDHAKLYAIKSEKDLRADLYQVLDVLKRMASRSFRGGLRVLELAASWAGSKVSTPCSRTNWKSSNAKPQSESHGPGAKATGVAKSVSANGCSSNPSTQAPLQKTPCPNGPKSIPQKHKTQTLSTSPATSSSHCKTGSG